LAIVAHRRLGVIALAMLVCGCAEPRYEVHRLSSGDTAWRRCMAGRDGEQRLASWCPEATVLAVDADLDAAHGDHAVVDLTPYRGLAGPLLVAIDTITYRPLGPDVTLKGIIPELRRRQWRGGLLAARRQLDAIHGSGRRVISWFDALPAEIQVRVPRLRKNRRAAWSVSAWTSGRAVERVDLAIPSVPANARLAISFAIADPGAYRGGPDVTFRIETVDGSRLWSQRVTAWSARHTPAWHDATIPLPQSNGPVGLRLVATVEGGEGAFSYPVWGQPALLVPASPRVDRSPNVMLVSLDTLRGDALDPAGRASPLMPTLDRFAAQGVTFRQAFSTFPSTTASHMSMMTSLHPCAHGVLMLNSTLSPGATTLAEAFAAAGWATAALTEDALIKGDVGFARGFDRYVDQRPYGRRLGIFGRGITRALDWIDQGSNRPFFLFLHTYQAHEPYKVPRHLLPLVSRSPDLDEFARLRSEYEAAVRYTDELLDRLLRGLAERGLLDTTLVVITSDHGQAFGEHGVHGHGSQVFAEQLHVPLVFHHPVLAAGGRRLDGPVSLIDLAPTLLRAAGVEPPASFAGRSLLPFSSSAPTGSPPSAVFSQNLWGQRLTSYRDAYFTWIETPDGETVYDRHGDPDERRPLSGPSQMAAARVGRDAIARFIADCKTTAVALQKTPAPLVAPIDAATQDALRALGYAE